jgi:hypothetical protein
MTWSEHLYELYASMKPPKQLPNDIQWLYPQKDPAVMEVLKRFLDKYFNDAEPRRLLFGINPGRFGAGITGVNFTAARQLTEYCGIEHAFPKGSELSAEFVYEFIHAYGGPEAFYKHFFIASICPLGFVKNGKNINYYDDKELQQTVEPFIVRNIKKLLSFSTDRSACGCIGEDKNYKYLCTLNERYGWFDRIVPLPHPRFIMQYKRKTKELYVGRYLEFLTSPVRSSKV